MPGYTCPLQGPRLQCVTASGVLRSNFPWMGRNSTLHRSAIILCSSNRFISVNILYSACVHPLRCSQPHKYLFGVVFSQCTVVTNENRLKKKKKKRAIHLFRRQLCTHNNNNNNNNSAGYLTPYTKVPTCLIRLNVTRRICVRRGARVRQLFKKMNNTKLARN